MSISFSSTIFVGSIGAATDFILKSPLSGNNSVKPKSISSKLYSHDDGDTLVTDGGAGVSPVNWLVDVIIEDVCVVNSEPDDVSDVIDAVDDGVDEIDTSVQLVVDVEKKSLLFNGSNADCDDKLSTEPQLIGFSSSP